MKAPRKLWTEDETKLALYLYFQLPFGQMHSRNPEIQKLASIIGRTDSSVAMKLTNFASLDPKITASGRKGLQGASSQDRRVWAQFSSDWTAKIAEAEEALNFKELSPRDENLRLRENVMPFSFEPFDGPTTELAIIDRRIGQNFFRRAVLANFDETCCVTGLADPVLLNASHIVPWVVDVQNRHNPANGLCLSATFDRAFDRGLVTLDNSNRVLISKHLLMHVSQKTRDHFSPFQGAPIYQSIRFDPDPALLGWHRSQRFIDAK